MVIFVDVLIKGQPWCSSKFLEVHTLFEGFRCILRSKFVISDIVLFSLSFKVCASTRIFGVTCIFVEYALHKCNIVFDIYYFADLPTVVFRVLVASCCSFLSRLEIKHNDFVPVHSIFNTLLEMFRYQFDYVVVFILLLFAVLVVTDNVHGFFGCILTI